jgi:hypothetical protein
MWNMDLFSVHPRATIAPVASKREVQRMLQTQPSRNVWEPARRQGGQPQKAAPAPARSAVRALGKVREPLKKTVSRARGDVRNCIGDMMATSMVFFCMASIKDSPELNGTTSISLSEPAVAIVFAPARTAS